MKRNRTDEADTDDAASTPSYSLSTIRSEFADLQSNPLTPAYIDELIKKALSGGTLMLPENETPSTIRVACTQLKFDSNKLSALDIESTGSSVKDSVVAAILTIAQVVKAQHADLVLLQELFSTPYFCQSQDADNLSLALEAEGNNLIETFRYLAERLQVREKE